MKIRLNLLLVQLEVVPLQMFVNSCSCAEEVFFKIKVILMHEAVRC